MSYHFTQSLSKFLKWLINILLLVLAGCYSFTGSSVPAHLKTLEILSIQDNSGYGNPLFRQEMSQLINEKFIADNSFNLASSAGDARLTIEIASISDQSVAISPGELETQRRITVNCQAEYFDAINSKQIFKKQFSNNQLYDLSNALDNRNEAILIAINQISDDILLAVVSGW